MKWAVEVRSRGLSRRNLSALLEGLGFTLVQKADHPAIVSQTLDECLTAAEAFSERLLEPIGYIPPAEYDENYYRRHEREPLEAVLN